MDGRCIWRVISRLTMWCACAVVCWPAQARGDEQPTVEPPTIEQLMHATPVLAIGDSQLQAISAKFEIESSGVSLGGRICWTRERKLGLVIWSGASRTPVLFVADGQALVLDRSKMKGVVIPGEDWRVGIERIEDSVDCSFGLGMNMENRVKLICDLRSFVRNPIDTVELQRDQDGDWLLIGTLPDGRGSWRAEYKDTEGYPLHRLESKLSKIRVVLTDIGVNERADVTWPAMPSPEKFPEPVRVRHMTAFRLWSIDRYVAQWWRLFKAYYTFVALDDPEYRSRLVFGFADWNHIQQRDAELAPALRKLLTPAEP